MKQGQLLARPLELEFPAKKESQPKQTFARDINECLEIDIREQSRDSGLGASACCVLPLVRPTFALISIGKIELTMADLIEIPTTQFESIQLRILLTRKLLD